MQYGLDADTPENVAVNVRAPAVGAKNAPTRMVHPDRKSTMNPKLESVYVSDTSSEIVIFVALLSFICAQITTRLPAATLLPKARVPLVFVEFVMFDVICRNVMAIGYLFSPTGTSPA